MAKPRPLLAGRDAQLVATVGLVQDAVLHGGIVG